MLKKLISVFNSSEAPKKKQAPVKSNAKSSGNSTKPKVQPTRIGELGEHKINIQLAKLPKRCKYLSELLVPNKKSCMGYSQIDHMVIFPQGLFVTETKNYTERLRENQKYPNTL